MYKKIEFSDFRAGLYDMPESVNNDPFAFLLTVESRDRKLRKIDEIIGTWKRSDGSLIYATNEREVATYNKIPDYHFIGDGKWVKE